MQLILGEMLSYQYISPNILSHRTKIIRCVNYWGIILQLTYSDLPDVKFYARAFTYL